ncbi:MAG: hemerythrin domain-containing protein [Gammaproteobacteria bacterium]|nr:hemerythrin domain-containing protein [Gammaproteobacteria bacterium]
MAAYSTLEILEQYEQVRHDQLKLCDRLEDIADSLPHGVDRQSCIYIARALGPLMARAHRIEEDQLFPAVEEMGNMVLDARTALAHLKLDHAGDICFAEELIEALMQVGRGDEVPGADTIGYMLRGFFESLRRHIAFETQLANLLRQQVKH